MFWATTILQVTVEVASFFLMPSVQSDGGGGGPGGGSGRYEIRVIHNVAIGRRISTSLSALFLSVDRLTTYIRLVLTNGGSIRRRYSRCT